MKIELQQWVWIAGIPATLGVVLFFSRAVVTFADMPKRVDTIEKYIEALQQQTAVQARANELMEQQQRPAKKNVQLPYCETDDQNITWCWDSENQEWYEAR